MRVYIKNNTSTLQISHRVPRNLEKMPSKKHKITMSNFKRTQIEKYITPLASAILCGRINVVKTIAISKLTFVCSVLNTPDTFANEVNKLIFDYVWKHKNPKVKKSTLIKSKEKGRLNMVDFTMFDKALKICWVKRLCSEDLWRRSSMEIHPTALAIWRWRNTSFSM